MIISGGSSGGKTLSARASRSLSPLAGASRSAGQPVCDRYRDAVAVHGKEKVYGSIP